MSLDAKFDLLRDIRDSLVRQERLLGLILETLKSGVRR